MLRMLLCSTAVLVIVAAGLVQADDTKKDKTNKDYEKATITKVDAKNHTVTVKMKDKDGKDTEKTFTLTEDATYWDSEGNVAKLDVFQSGEDVLIVEKDGKIKELKKGAKKTPCRRRISNPAKLSSIFSLRRVENREAACGLAVFILATDRRAGIPLTGQAAKVGNALVDVHVDRVIRLGQVAGLEQGLAHRLPCRPGRWRWRRSAAGS